MCIESMAFSISITLFPSLRGLSCWSAQAGRLWSRLCRAIGGDDPQVPTTAVSVPTEELIRRFQQGQPLAFEALYHRFKDLVYRTALFITRNGSEAEDAVQETFIDVLQALPNYRIEGPARFETWLYRVTVNRCRSRMRRKALPQAGWEDLEERLERIPEVNPDHDPERVTVERERASALWQAVDMLPESHRVVVLLRYQHNLSYREIAQVLGVRLGTIKSRLHNAMRMIREALESEKESGRGPGEV